MRRHLDVVVDLVLEEVVHLDDVGVPQPVPPEVVEHVNLQRDGAESTVARPRVDKDASLGDVLEYAFFASVAVSRQLDLPVGALAHFLEDGEVIDRLLLCGLGRLG